LSDAALRAGFVRNLRDRLDALTDFAVLSVTASLPVYRSPSVSGNLHFARSIEEGLKSFVMPREERMSTTGWPGQVGRWRAQQGVPLEAMHRAYQVTGQVLFGAFLEWAAEEELPRECLLAMADDVWYGVVLHSDAATVAFRAAEDEMSGDWWVGGMLDALLGGDDDRDCAAAVALALGWAEQARYAVVVARPAGRGAPELTQAELPARAAGIRVVWRLREECAIGVAALGDASATAFAEALPTRPGRCVGVSLAVDGLAELGRGRRLAELAGRMAAIGGGTTCFERLMPGAAAGAQPDLVGGPVARVLGPVLALDRASRDRILDTLAAWVASGGSVDEAAVALGCHRNTVVNRVRRLERLTRRSLSVPSDLVELVLAMEAFRIPGPRTAGNA
jgi:hypothetical protein